MVFCIDLSSSGTRQLVDDSKPIGTRLDAVLNGKYKVERVGLNFLTKVLAVHNPIQFAVWNKVVEAAMKDFGYETARGSSEGRTIWSLQSS